MEFSPNNPIVKLCIRALVLETEGKPADAAGIFMEAWRDGTDDLEKFIAAHHVARHQVTAPDRLKWLETALQLALKINDDAVKAAFVPLYESIAKCHEELGNTEDADRNRRFAKSFAGKPSDKGPFFHGTKADLRIGDLLTPGFGSNYQSGLTMNHIYFTALPNGAGLAASLAKGEGRERVYVVEPTGSFEDDPNVTNKKFPGNVTRSYRTDAPLKIVGEITNWASLTPEELKKWREKLENTKGEIIN